MEESTTLEKKSTQDKICNLVRFLDSLSLPRNDMSGGGAPFYPHGLYSERCMVVLRAANQNLLIAGGNHTLIPSMNHRRYIGYTVYGAIPSTRTGCKCHVAGGRPYMRNTIQPHGFYSERCMVMLRAANQNLLIAGGNHTLIPSMDHRRYIGGTYDEYQRIECRSNW